MGGGGVTFAESIERLIRTYRESILLADASAIDYSRDVINHGSGGHGKHGTTTTTPSFGADVPLSVEMERFLARAGTVFARRLEAERRGATATVPNGDTRSKAKRDETSAILAEVGRDATEVAYLYGRTTEAVRKLRLRHGMDADRGERVRVLRPVTAPARDQLQHHESATTTEETNE